MGDRLRGKTAIVTGAATGIGKASSLLFAQEGAFLVLADLDEIKGHQVTSEISAAGGKAIFVPTDVSKADEVQYLVQEAVRVQGKVDVLFNNAAINFFGSVTDTPEEEWDRVIGVNVRSVFLGCKYTIPFMKDNGGGSIINTASVAGIVGLKNLAAYTASKGAVMQLTKNVALDYASFGIRINALCPGVTATEMTLKVIADSPDPDATRRRYDTGRPMGRIGEPNEIAQAALFLASDESTYITGTSLVVDGGYCAE
jgi:meso-butanediol dehydrogenase / (S,S)-butanediol dehydrogenase / diacetyl reductase